MRHYLLILINVILISNTFADQSKKLGELKIYYSVINSSYLEPNIAKSFNIIRSKSLGIINIAPKNLRTQRSSPVKITGNVKNLLGQNIDLSFKQIKDGKAVYNIALFPIKNRDILTFTIHIFLPSGKKDSFTLTQEVFQNEN